MASGILYVESTPRSPAHLAAFHRWYDEVHIPEILTIAGFVSARRFASVDDASFIAIYEIDGDLGAAQAAVAARHASGTMTPPNGVQLDPPPVARYFTVVGENPSERA